MKKYFILLGALLFLFSLLNVKRLKADIFAPELFAYGAGYGIETEGFEVYLIQSTWGKVENEKLDFVFVMFGIRQKDYFSGFIFQAFGDRIGSYAPYDCGNFYFYCYQHEAKENWRGWIDFRGHKRPMCGGDKIKHPCLILFKE